VEAAEADAVQGASFAPLVAIGDHLEEEDEDPSLAMAKAYIKPKGSGMKAPEGPLVFLGLQAKKN